MFSWLLYPLHCFMMAIRLVCLQGRNQPDQERHNKHEFLLELGSAAERAICYGQTGNAKVICNDVMGPLLLKPSLLNNGMPTIDREFLPKSGAFSWRDNQWPLTRTGRAQSSAHATLSFWYGPGVAEVRYISRTFKYVPKSSHAFRPESLR
jgi:hypothetical protein